VDVGIHGDVVIGKIAGGGNSGGGIVNGFFVQGHPEAHDDAAKDLAAGCLGIDDATAIHD